MFACRPSRRVVLSFAAALLAAPPLLVHDSPVSARAAAVPSRKPPKSLPEAEPDAAPDTGPPTGPLLCFDSGHPEGGGVSLDEDRAGQFIVTASNDKSARVWDARTGQLLRTLRPPSDDGKDGALNAVAISPDARLIAVGGYTGWNWDRANSIYLFDRETGALVRRMAGLPEAIPCLSFSPDGRYLAAGCMGIGTGLHLFRVGDGREIGPDTHYGLSCVSIDWAGNDRLVTASGDGAVRLYAVPAEGDPAAGTSPHSLLSPLVSQTFGGTGGPERPATVRCSPDGKRIAVGVRGGGPVILDSRNLAPLATPDVAGLPEPISVPWADWAGNGRTLYGLSGSRDKNQNYLLRRWTQSGAGNPVAAGGDWSVKPAPFLSGIRAAVLSFLPSAESDGLSLQPPPAVFVLGIAGGVFGLDGSSGRVVWDRGPLAAAYPLSAVLQANQTGTVIRFGCFEGGGVLHYYRFSLTDRTLTTLSDYKPDPEFFRPRRTGKGLEITDWRNYGLPRLNGQILSMELGAATDLAITPKASRFVISARRGLYCFDKSGQKMWFADTSGGANTTNITGNARIAVASFDDGTIRWFHLTDGREILRFFFVPSTRQWVLATPEGEYVASEKGEGLIRWQINHGRDDTPEYLPAARFHDRFCQPKAIDALVAQMASGKIEAPAARTRKPRQGSDATMPAPAATDAGTKADLEPEF